MPVLLLEGSCLRVRLSQSRRPGTKAEIVIVSSRGCEEEMLDVGEMLRSERMNSSGWKEVRVARCVRIVLGA